MSDRRVTPAPYDPSKGCSPPPRRPIRDALVTAVLWGLLGLALFIAYSVAAGLYEAARPAPDPHNHDRACIGLEDVCAQGGGF